MLTCTNQLSAQQLTDLEKLCDLCKATDSNLVAFYKHYLSQKRSSPCNILYYQQNQLIGFLSLFFFYKDACEIALMVAPAHRRDGIASRLIKECLSLIKTQPINTLIFSAPSELNTHWLSIKGFHHCGSEYQMQRLQGAPLMVQNDSLILRLAILEDIEALCAIDRLCFQTQQSNLEGRFHELLNSQSHRLFLALKDGNPIGKAHVSFQQETNQLSDIGIIPSLQGQGYGSLLISHCINFAQSANKKPVSLDVETTNQHALKLYTQLGFTVVNAYDFWSIPIETLTFILRFAWH